MSSDDFEATLGAIFLVVLVCYLIAAFVCSMQMNERTITISEKVPVKPLKIIDTEENMYVVQDQITIGYFESGNTYAKIKESGTYNVTTSGIRFPILSWFPNVIKIQKV